LGDLKEEDAGNYICVATSAGVFHIETISDLEVLARGKGKLRGSLCRKRKSGITPNPCIRLEGLRELFDLSSLEVAQ